MASSEKEPSGKGADKKKEAGKEPATLFQLDAKVLLAKLHYAARTQIPNDYIVKNSAIPVDVEGDNSKSLENMKETNVFDLNSGEKQEIGIFLPFTFVPTYEEITKDYAKIVTTEQKIDSDKIKEIEDALNKENEDRKAEKEKRKDELKKKALELMQTYFQHFLGKQNANKVRAQSLIEQAYPNIQDAKDIEKIQIKKGKILPPSKKDLEDNETQKKIVEEFTKEAKTKTSDLAKGEVTIFVCYKAGYTLDFGK